MKTTILNNCNSSLPAMFPFFLFWQKLNNHYKSNLHVSDSELSSLFSLLLIYSHLIQLFNWFFQKDFTWDAKYFPTGSHVTPFTKPSWPLITTTWAKNKLKIGLLFINEFIFSLIQKTTHLFTRYDISFSKCCSFKPQ